MNSSPHTLTEVSIDEINIGERRQTDPKMVQHYAESIQEVGLLHPITLTKGLTLIGGRHRLEAHQLLERTMISAVILDIKDLQAELAEIDENLVRCNFDALGLGESLVRRKEIFEELHPETKHGGSQKSEAAKSNGNNCHLIAFADDAAQKMGKSPRTIRQYVKVAEDIPLGLRKLLRGTNAGGKITALEKISKLPAVDQEAVVKEIVDGAETVFAAVTAIEAKGELSAELQAILGPKADKNVQEEGGGDEDPAGNDVDVADEAPPTAQGEEVPPASSSPAVETSAGADADLETASADSTEPSTESLTTHHDPVSDSKQSEADSALDLYNDLLQGLPDMIGLFNKHMAYIARKTLDKSEAAERLLQASKFFKAAHLVTLQLAKSDTSSSD